MKSSYKKHLYTTTLSLSAAVLLSVIGHGQVSADSLEAPQTEPSTVLEAAPATEQAVTAETASPATAEKGDTAAPATSAEAAATSDVASTTEVAPAASPSTNRAATTADQATRLADSTIYLSEKSTIDDKVQEKAQAAGKISWTLDNKPLSEWKTWDMETGTLSKDPFLTITETANGNDLDLHIDVQDLFGEDLSLRSPNNIRRTYRNYIGNHELVGTNADLGVTINKTLVFRPYQDYHTHEEMLAAIEKSKEEAYKAVFEDASSFSEYSLDDTNQAEDLVAYLNDNGFTAQTIDEIMVAEDASGETLGYAFTITDSEGYGGDIQFAMGVQNDGTLNGISILSISETAGLGMKATTDDFKNQFKDKNVEKFTYTKTGASSDDEIDAISGATITTNAMTNGVNAGLCAFRYVEGGAES